jgi:hypothetical protein
MHNGMNTAVGASTSGFELRLIYRLGIVDGLLHATLG